MNDPDFRPYTLPEWERKCIECSCPVFDYYFEGNNGIDSPHCFLGHNSDNEKCPINGLTYGEMFTCLKGV